MTTYADIEATLQDLFGHENGGDIWWLFDSDHGEISLTVYYETRDAITRFHELFGRDLPGMKMAPIEDVDPFATTMVPCEAGMKINWSLCDRWFLNPVDGGYQGLSVCSNETALQLKKLMKEHHDILFAEIERKYKESWNTQ